MAWSQRTMRDFAYVCFFPPGLVCVIGAIADTMDLDPGTAGGVGFLILIPLTLVSLVTVPFGIYSAVAIRKDYVLLILTALTVLLPLVVILLPGAVQFVNVSVAIYGVAVMVLVGSWFFARRFFSKNL